VTFFVQVTRIHTTLRDVTPTTVERRWIGVASPLGTRPFIVPGRLPGRGPGGVKLGD